MLHCIKCDRVRCRVPLCVQRDCSELLVCEGRDFLLVLVRGSSSIRPGVPACECVAGSFECVGIQILCNAVLEDHVIHDLRRTFVVGLEHHIVVVLAEGCADGDVACGTCLDDKVVCVRIDICTVVVDIVAGEAVAHVRDECDRNEDVAVADCVLAEHDCGVSVLETVCNMDRVRLKLPLCVEGYDCAVSCRKVDDFSLVVEYDSESVGSGAPAGECVAVSCICVGAQCLCFVECELLIEHVAGCIRGVGIEFN